MFQSLSEYKAFSVKKPIRGGHLLKPFLKLDSRRVLAVCQCRFKDAKVDADSFAVAKAVE